MIGSGFVPFAIFVAAIVAFYVFLKRVFNASKNETVQAIFVLLVMSFVILTMTGVWFPGAGLALVWPWQT